MINIHSLDDYFLKINEPLTFGDYTFKIISQQEKEIFVLDLKITQKDNKEEHHIKFRFGIGKGKKEKESSHETDEPHFEIDISERKKESFSVTLYFKFNKSDDESIMEYAKGTIVLINKIIKQFITSRKLDQKIINEIIYEDEVNKELAKFEPKLINALFDCYKNNDLRLRQGKESLIIKTPHNLKKYLGLEDLQPLFLPLMKKVKEK